MPGEWIANSDTFLKRSKAAASQLPNTQKIFVEAGQVLTCAEHHHEIDHTRLSGAVLEGRQLDAPHWFAYAPHWSPRPATSKALVVSMGFNGYQTIYASNIASHRQYCERIGAAYVFVDKPDFTPLTMESTWLKIPLLLTGLAAGYEWIMYLDADTEVKAACPDMRSLASLGGDLLMAKGFSGRVNAGVVIVRRSDPVARFLKTLLVESGKELPPEDHVPWGDNGYFIHFGKTYGGLRILPTEWNNNRDPSLRDYIRHYSAGPMRAHFPMSQEQHALVAQAEAYGRTHGVRLKGGSPAFFRQLEDLYATALAGSDLLPPIPWAREIAPAAFRDVLF